MPTRSRMSACRSHRCPERSHIFLGQRYFFHLRINHDVRGVALSQQGSVIGSRQLILKLNQGLANVLQMRAYNNFIVVARRSLIAATGIDDGDAATIFCLHVAIRKPELPQQFYSADFEPHEVIGMIDHAHLVSLSVAHPQASLTDDRMIVCASGHSPLHRGLRFSRNDEMPSRKSAVARIAAFSRTADCICASSSTRACLLSRRLVHTSDAGLFSNSCNANSRARSLSFSGGTISLIRPMRCASWALMILPVSSRSLASFSPTWRSRKVETIAGTNPIRTSV